MNNTHGHTWRERLADWISGGRLSFLTETLSEVDRDRICAIDEALSAIGALYRIRAATKDGKSGTAREVARMAEDALK